MSIELPQSSRPIRVFCTDVDGTVAGNPESMRRFRSAWMSLPPGTRPTLIYASGRLVQDVIDLLSQRELPWPDYIIGGVGTQIYDAQRKKGLSEYSVGFKDGWNLRIIEDVLKRWPGVTQQPPVYLHQFKSSWYLKNATPEDLMNIRQHLTDAGIRATVIYSSCRDLDILPLNASKGSALRWLSNRLGIPLDEVLVAGDTGNDASMFLLPGVQGILVENAHPELIEAAIKVPTFNATKVMADGVLEGLEWFGVIPVRPHPRLTALTADQMDPTLRMLFTETAIGSLTSDERDLIATAYSQAIQTIRKNITPLGFSACSLAENEVTGTDVNYRSVWARDGAITIIGTIELDDPDIRAAQKNTLQTLFDHLAPNGQVPSNVRIDGGVPDYSGIGGICSVDSALWAVIAFYAWVRKHGDHQFLQAHFDKLQQVMQWLCALDANNDLLLEIPEAGDWTDLFGRSYHVLYDEVLWYRANISFARLLEMQQLFGPASDCLKRSQAIRSRILETFWPTTQPRSDGSVEQFQFARGQSAVGDSCYLLAEVTPFSFNWRCDVLGNIQAFLSNVLDIDRARTAFRFMWGAGVNEPFPVVNLYPPVQSGDPDWRSYYTVNLLNLPGHYHNGGIWPFIGGMWVRFIHRLGLHEVASHELLKLAQLNKLGRQQEWEFNEWIHSRTGRPMGKCFQAWSASSFIHACQELQFGPENPWDSPIP